MLSKCKCEGLIARQRHPSTGEKAKDLQCFEQLKLKLGSVRNPSATGVTDAGGGMSCRGNRVNKCGKLQKKREEKGTSIWRSEKC